MIRRNRTSSLIGFTILEMLIVIAILGMISSIIIPNLLESKEKAAKQKAKIDLLALESALEMYKLDNDRYPSTQQGIQALVKLPEEEPIPKNYRAKGYIKRIPKDPWKQEYQYLFPGIYGEVDIFTQSPSDESLLIGNWNMFD